MAISAEDTRQGEGRTAETADEREALRRALTERVDGEIRFDPGSRAAYAHDSSNYQQPPIGVVVPRTVEAGAEAVRVCAEHGVPVLSRGGGTSLAGQCVNTAIVIDWSKYCRELVSSTRTGGAPSWSPARAWTTSTTSCPGTR